jgi:hypothetical protein
MRNNLVQNCIVICGIMLVSFTSLSCYRQHKSFSIDKEQVVRLLNDSSYVSTFVKDWKLRRCYKDDYVDRYCYRDSLIIYESSRLGFLLTVSNIPIQDLDKLLSDFRSTLGHIEIKDLDNYQKHLGNYDLDYAEYFFNNEYDIMVGAKETGKGRIFVIAVNRNRVYQ